MNSSPEIWDTLIIGAGPAGLTAGIYLGRFGRKCQILHNDDSRVAWIPGTHNHPGFPDGISGPELLSRMSKQAARYGARLIKAEVTSLDKEGDTFVLGTAQTLLKARYVILATGVADVRPTFKELFSIVQRGLLRLCPICDGYEVRGKRVVVLGDGDHGAREARFLRLYSTHVALIPFKNGAEITPQSRDELAKLSIEVLPAESDEIVFEKDRIQVRGRIFDVMYSALGLRPRTTLAARLGALHDGSCLVVNHHQETTVPGLYAAGDIVRGLNQITVAEAEGTIAATAINNRLFNAS